MSDTTIMLQSNNTGWAAKTQPTYIIQAIPVKITNLAGGIIHEDHFCSGIFRDLMSLTVEALLHVVQTET